MLIKQCQFSSRDRDGIYFHLLRPGYRNSHLVKTASAANSVLDEVQAVMKGAPKDPNLLYALVSAMGAWEYYGQNSNGDAFPERSLIHTPKGWDELSSKEKPPVGRNWEWGYPTFYNAHAFHHHCNKDPARAFGSVYYAMWDPFMKRVLLVIAFDRKRAEAMGSISVLDKIENGEFPEVSMGCRVPYDICVPAGTPILTEDGHLPVEGVEEGDPIRSHTGKLRKVVRTFQRTANELCKVRATGMGDALRCTPNHPLFVLPEVQPRSCNGSANGKKRRHSLTGSGKCAVCKREVEYTPEWKAAEDLQFGDYLLTPIRQVPPNEPKGGWAYARTVGYYIADGSRIRQRRGRKRDGPYALQGLQLSTRLDEDHIERVIGSLYHACGKEPRRYPEPGKQAASLHLYDQDLAARVVDSCGSGAREKRIPEECFGWPESLRWELLGALIDTDGSFDKQKQSARYSTVSSELALDVVDLCFSLGIPASSQHGVATSGYGGETDYYSVFLPKEHSRLLERHSERVAQKIRPPKENEKASGSAIFFWNGYACAPVVELELEELDEPIEVFNFQVDQDESYVAQGVAVHNCTRCTDWDRVTGNPKVDLANHRKNPIRGLSETTKDYCEHLKNELGRIYSDGVQAGMVNLHPRFFDLSVVFIGADKTSRVMAKLAGKCPIRPHSPACGKCKDCDISSAHVHEVWSREKVASDNEMLKEAFGSSGDWGITEADERRMNKYFSKWKSKRAEIEKRVKSNFEPMLSEIGDREEDLPEGVLKGIACDMPKGLSTAGSLGVVLKPREFQRTMLISMGKQPLADELDSKGVCFRCGASAERSMDIGGVLPSLIEKLIPALSGRSAFGPAFHKRIIIMVTGGKPSTPEKHSEEDEHPLLKKLSSAYTDYRRQLLYKVADGTSRLIEERPQVLLEMFPEAVDLSFSHGIAKTGGNVMESLIGTMPVMYLNGAYLDEPVSRYVQANSDLSGLVAAGSLAAYGRVA